MISRQWRGLAQPHRAQDYIEHLRSETFPALRTIPGFIDASILSRPFGQGVEFLIVTRWNSMEAIARFSSGSGTSRSSTERYVSHGSFDLSTPVGPD